MHIAVTGSIATDHLMVFPGRFTDQLIPERLDRVSLSFLADHLEVRRGGVGANVALGLARLGLTPLLVGAAGNDFADYRAWLKDAGVDTRSVRVSETLHTARFVCTTDSDQNQIATFYAGAMAEAGEIDLRHTAQRVRKLDLVLIGADDPNAMLRHTATAHRLNCPVAADPSQQLARVDRQQARALVDGARYVFTNEYEAALLLEHTGWTESQVLGRVGTWVTTLAERGVSLTRADGHREDVPAVATDRVADPTGAGDAFRAGFLAGVSWGLPHRRAAQVGCALASTALESVGTQEYKLVPSELVQRIALAYGQEAADAVTRPWEDAPWPATPG